jgi:hypothetical protein
MLKSDISISKTPYFLPKLAIVLISSGYISPNGIN